MVQAGDDKTCFMRFFVARSLRHMLPIWFRNGIVLQVIFSGQNQDLHFQNHKYIHTDSLYNGDSGTESGTGVAVRNCERAVSMKIAARNPVVLTTGGIAALIFGPHVLVLNISLYYVFTHISKCTHIITVGPEMSAPQFLMLDFWMRLEKGSRSIAL
jgi:hypothetical protein